MCLHKEINEISELLITKLDQDQERYEEEGHQAILEWQQERRGQHTEHCIALYHIYNEYFCYLNYNFHECDIFIE
jgi:hypothetical protein